MKFGDRIRELRRSKKLGQRALAEIIGTNFTYISKIENHRLDFGDYPSEEMIHKLADALEVDEEQLLLLAEKVPSKIKQIIFKRPELFQLIAELDEKALDALTHQLTDSNGLSQSPVKPR